MTARVRYLAQLRRLAGRAFDEAEIEWPQTVEEVVRAIARRNPTVSAHLLNEEGRMRRSVLVFQGEEQLHGVTLLQGPCELDVMTPIAGG